MKESQYITPRLGRGSIFVLGLTLIAGVTISAAFLRRFGSETIYAYSETDVLARFRFLMCLTGMTYGLCVGIGWLTTIIESRYLRWSVRAISVICLATIQQQLGTESWVQGLASLGGLMCCQCMLFHWIGVPNWTSAPDQANARPEVRQNQFGIGDIVIANTCTAILLAIVIRYPTPINPLGYWLILGVFWLVGPVIAACAALSLLHREGMSVGLLSLSFVLALGGVAGLTTAELVLGEPSQAPSDLVIGINASLYGLIMIGYLVTFVLFCIAAKTDVVVTPETRAELDI